MDVISNNIPSHFEAPGFRIEPGSKSPIKLPAEVEFATPEKVTYHIPWKYVTYVNFRGG